MSKAGLRQEAVPYSTGPQMKCVYTATYVLALISHLHVGVNLCHAAFFLFCDLVAGDTMDCRTCSCVLFQ